MGLAFSITTMNSEVKVRLVDGSEFVQEEAAGPRRWAGLWEFFVAGRRWIGNEGRGRRTAKRRRGPRSLVVVEEKVAISPEAASVSGLTVEA